MVAAFLLITYIVLLAWLSGALLQILFSHPQTSGSIHPTVTILFGLAGITTLLQPIHLFLPIDLRAHLIVMALVLIVSFIHRNRLADLLQAQKNTFLLVKDLRLLFPLLILIALINIIGRAGVGDIADYHLQAIQWDEKYAVVKGLGNLRRQLGNNSGWFLLHAFAGAGFLQLNAVYILNALLLVLGIWYFFHRLTSKFSVMSGVILLYLALMAYRKYVGAVTNDYAITIFTLIILSELFHSTSDTSLRRMLLILTLILPAFKLSSLAMLMVPVWYLSTQLNSAGFWKEFRLLLIAACMIYLPWFYISWIQSGYLIYPIEFTAFGNPDWKMKTSTLAYERIINMANERVPGMPTDEVMNLGITQWFPRWIKSVDAFSKLLLMLFLALPTFVTIRLFANSSFHQRVKNLFKDTSATLLFPLLIVALPLWFLNAPAMRFMFGYMVFTVAWFAEILAGDRSRNLIQKWMKPLFTAILILGAVPFCMQYISAERLSASVWQPLKYGQNKMYCTPVPGGYVFTPDSAEQCWDAPIPATSIIDSSLHWRSNELGDGFSVQLTD